SRSKKQDVSVGVTRNKIHVGTYSQVSPLVGVYGGISAHSVLCVHIEPPVSHFNGEKITVYVHFCIQFPPRETIVVLAANQCVHIGTHANSLGNEIPDRYGIPLLVFLGKNRKARTKQQYASQG